MLTAQDRCDSCRAQAFVETVVKGTALLWCGHHWVEYADNLVMVATSIKDHREPEWQ